MTRARLGMLMHPLVLGIDVHHAHHCCFAVLKIGPAVSTVRCRWNQLMMQVIVLDVCNLLQRYHATSLAIAGAKAPIGEITVEIRLARLRTPPLTLDACSAGPAAVGKGRCYQDSPYVILSIVEIIRII